MANSYKALKENFVSNLSGGSIAEVNLVTAVAPVSTLPKIFRRILLMPCRQHTCYGPSSKVDWTSLKRADLSRP